MSCHAFLEDMGLSELCDHTVERQVSPRCLHILLKHLDLSTAQATSHGERRERVRERRLDELERETLQRTPDAADEHFGAPEWP